MIMRYWALVRDFEGAVVTTGTPVTRSPLWHHMER